MALTQADLPRIPLSLGQVLSAARRNTGLRQEELGARLAEELELPKPISRETISRWERDLGEPPFSVAVKWARLGHWPISDLEDALTRSRCFSMLRLVSDVPLSLFDDFDEVDDVRAQEEAATRRSSFVVV